MDPEAGLDIDAWLREGGLVVASSDRAARAIQAAFHRRRRREGLTAWPAPKIVDWHSFIASLWQDRRSDSRLVLNAAQEKSIWSEIIRSDEHLLTTLPPSVRRLAAMAMEAYDLLCSYAPTYLKESARSAWDQDAAAFSHWLAEFDRHCRTYQLVSQSRVALDLITDLENDKSARPPLRLAGFDRVLPSQNSLFNAWGSWQKIELAEPTSQISFHSVRDSQSELEACAWWCYQQIRVDRNARLLVVTQDLAQRRGEIERAFLRFNPPDAAAMFELSLGVPLSQVPLAQSALLLLRWLSGALREDEVDWLFSLGAAASTDEAEALQGVMRKVRWRDQQRTEWTIEAFMKELSADASAPAAWVHRIGAGQLLLKGFAQLQSHFEWADKVPRLLELVGWPGAQTQTSAGFQALRRWQRALDMTGSLGFMESKISWQDFLTELESTVAETLFAPESTDAPIQIAGPAESSGITVNAVWFLGADEAAWPAVAPMHPFLPVGIQRQSAMPHASPARDWEFSSLVTHRLMASADVVTFSFAMQKDDVEVRPSRLIKQVAGQPQALPQSMRPPVHQASLASEYIDSGSVPFNAGQVRGGAGALSSQSQCPFKAFARTRLAAQGWDAAEAGLSARQRGKILHDVLHSVWSGPPRGIRGHADLIAVQNLAAFVQDHVRKVIQNKVPQAVRDQMPRLYIDLEETRLVRLVSEWLEFEKSRFEFSVEETEADRSISVAGLAMSLRLDRVDRLKDDSKLVVDYKTGSVDPRGWDLPRPEDVQLPLYKIFATQPAQQTLFERYSVPASGGLVFAEVRIGEACFAGRVADARQTLKPDLSSNSAIVKRKLTATQETEWKRYIEKLAGDFIHGIAEVDPRDYPKTCERCGLQSLCRIQEPENRERFELRDAQVDEAND